MSLDLSLSLSPSPGRGFAQERGRRRAVAGAVGGGRDVRLSIAPQSGELQAQRSEHERQRA